MPTWHKELRMYGMRFVKSSGLSLSVSLVALLTLGATAPASARGMFSIVLQNGKCLDVHDADFQARRPGARIQQWDCHGGAKARAI